MNFDKIDAELLEIVTGKRSAQMNLIPTGSKADIHIVRPTPRLPRTPPRLAARDLPDDTVEVVF